MSDRKKRRRDPFPSPGDGHPLAQPSPPKGREGLAIPVRSLLGFLIRSLLIFVALLALWGPASHAYGRLFRTTGNILVGQGSEGRVCFERAETHDESHDAQIVVIDPNARLKRTTQISSRRHGYMPTSFLIALILATPVAWPRRFRSVLWGLLAVNAYIAAKLILFPIAYGGDDPVGAWTLPGGLRWLFWVVGASSVGWMLVPLLIWAVLTFRTLGGPRSSSTS
jgi:hypothetical protein